MTKENLFWSQIIVSCQKMGVCGFFLSVKFATSVLALLAGGLLFLAGMLKIVRKLLKNAARVDRE